MINTVFCIIIVCVDDILEAKNAAGIGLFAWLCLHILKLVPIQSLGKSTVYYIEQSAWYLFIGCLLNRLIHISLKATLKRYFTRHLTPPKIPQTKLNMSECLSEPETYFGFMKYLENEFSVER